MNTKLINICPTLDVFNKIYIKRNGSGLVHNIELKGSSDDIKTFINDEIALLSQNSIIINKKPITDKNEKNSPQLFLLENDTDLQRVEQNIYFFTKFCKNKNKNTFDISGYAINPLQVIVDTINLKGLSLDDVRSAVTLCPNLSHAKFINDTILQHYSKYNDDDFHKDDFNWIHGYKTPATVNVDKLMESFEKESVIEPKTNDNPKAEDEQSLAKERNDVIEETTSNEKVIENQEAPNANIEVTNSNIPIPTKTKTEVIEQTVEGKPILTKDEEKANIALLEDITKKYNDLAEFIKNLRASQWLPLLDQIKDEIKNCKYTEQLCPIYLKISEDISSELYNRLYQLDIDTKNFNESIIHQTIKLGCFACGQEWTEDITFLEKGPHFIECPHCYAERGFEK